VATAFQSSAFQRTGYQIAPAVQPQLVGFGALIGRRAKQGTKRAKHYTFAADAGVFSLDACGAEFLVIRTADLIAMDNDFLLFAD
jgi:hypothetical protein